MSIWPVLPVLLPALAAAGLVLLRAHLVVQRAVSLIACIALIAIACRLLVEADSGSQIVYALGDWRPPFGIVLVVDRLSALMLLVTALLALPAVLSACGGEDDRGPFFHPLVQFQLMGLNGAFLTGDLFNLFVFFEVLLIASYCLLLHGQTDRRLRAGLHYVTINLVGSSLFLIAAALLYGMTGTLNLADLATAIPRLDASAKLLVHSGALLLLVVFALKAAVFPLLLWLPPTYSTAAASVAALFAIMTKVGIYAIVRIYPLVFGPAAGEAAPNLELWILPAALLTMTCGALAALASRRLAGVAAQLTLVSSGTILVGAALFTSAALSAALYYLAHSTFAGALLFLVSGLIAAQRGERADALRRAVPLRHPHLSGLLFLLAAAAVAGIPPLSGFLGKTMLLQAVIDHDAVSWIWLAILATSFLAIIALMRGGMLAFWATPARAEPIRDTGSLGPTLLGAGVLLLLVLLVSVAAEPIKRYTDAAAGQLLDTTSYIRSVMVTGGRP
ncbi:MAG TPA: monovalent cation/H+ antiporter subunit D [Burkholderiales bacterium]|nr:monovalent cation/H+ antiporter subunit D [Burkholderiales bacterium]